MTAEELQAWLETHIYDIHAFMDYEPTIDSDDELMTTLGYWFRRDDWREAEYRFVHLGIDGMGSQFAAWIRPGAEGGLASYRAAVVERFGEIAGFSELTDGLDELNDEFCSWIDG
jgi:hypothetical protein